ncbi:histidine phosphatase family protein [Mycobacterium sp. 1274756.6]|uniref:histidine phosphatase family protein n=1 Tax=Mycobacterium sp. 1274756.6 TaxID=1834076 RepID=UPI0007FDF8E0|nr:histidine phosphatase family protein [Mycobacterium sp. 1274756.6]OBJ68776.1 hypothetical protein A5643_13810 [Mycobacterium sp. 1274756.6]
MTARLRPLVAAPLAALLLTGSSAVARAADAIVIDFVRHGEAGAHTVIDNSVPGPVLTPAGWGQAHQVVDLLDGHGIDAIFTSGMTRAQETAEPLARMLDLVVPAGLPGLNEIDAGIFADLPVKTGGLPIGAVAYAAVPFLWTLGLYGVPQPGTALNGMVFQDQFGSAVQSLYEASVAGGDDHVAVFGHQASIAMWALMNADNPDYLLMARLALTTGELLPYGGVVEMAGSPTDGWTLVDWAGYPVPPASLPVELFVDARDLITAPQLAVQHLWDALGSADPAVVTAALGAGADQVGTALWQFPFAVGGDLIDAALNPAETLTGLGGLSGEAVAVLAAVLSLL